jgi:hypothetical protein
MTPFVTLILIARDSVMVLPLFVLINFGNLMYFALNVADLYKQGWKKYFKDQANYSNVSILLAHTTFIFL